MTVSPATNGRPSGGVLLPAAGPAPDWAEVPAAGGRTFRLKLAPPTLPAALSAAADRLAAGRLTADALRAMVRAVACGWEGVGFRTVDRSDVLNGGPVRRVVLPAEFSPGRLEEVLSRDPVARAEVVARVVETYSGLSPAEVKN